MATDKSKLNITGAEVPPLSLESFSMPEIIVELDYSDFLGQWIIFYMRPTYSGDLKRRRQAYFALDKEEREAKQDEFEMEMFCALQAREPQCKVTGGEPRPLKDFPVEGPLEVRMKSYFTSGDEQAVEIKDMISNAAMLRYGRMTQPAQFFRGS